MMSIHRRELTFGSFDEVAREIDRLQARGYERAGNWGLGQICRHLSIFLRGSLEGFDFHVPWIIRKTLGPLFLRRILKKGRMPSGVRVPEKLLPPPAEHDDPDAIAACKELLVRAREAAVFHPSPFFGNLTPGQWRRLHLIHCAHHLSFLIQATKDRSGIEPFPR